MLASRSLGVAMLLGVAGACTLQPGSAAPKPLKPREGPALSLRVGYQGGLLQRSVTAYFRSEENAFVMVAHLGGDGVIQVIYPEAPDEIGLVSRHKMFHTRTFEALHDGIPSLYSHAIAPYRSLSTLYDSYDGRGHGYVFAIASRRPLRTDLISEGGGWSDLAIESYSQIRDPRFAVREFADAIAGGAPYTLKFASSYMTSNYDSYASRAWDCALLSSFGFGYSPWWSSWSYGAYGMRSYDSYCRGRDPFARYSSYPLASGTRVIVPTTGQPTVPAPTLNRPGRRGLGDAATGTTGRSTLSQAAPSARTGTLGNREPSERAPSGQRRQPFGASSSRPSRDAGRPSRPSDTRSSDTRSARPRESSASTGSSSGSASTGSSGASTRSSDTKSGSDSRGVTSPRDARKPN